MMTLEQLDAQIDALFRAGAATPTTVAKILGCDPVTAGRAMLAHRGWIWPFHGRLDPRPDLSDDSDLWENLLEQALKTEPVLARSLWVVRQAGGMLVPHSAGGYRIASGDGWKRPTQYDEFKRRYFAPHAARLTEWLRHLGTDESDSIECHEQNAVLRARMAEKPCSDGKEYQGSYSVERSLCGQTVPSGGVMLAMDTLACAPGWQMIQHQEDLKRICAAASTAGVCGLDVETAPKPRGGRWPDLWRDRAGLDPHLGRIRLLQIAVPDEPPAILDLSPWWDDPEAMAAVLRPVATLLSDPQVVKVGHNQKFDLKMLRAALGGRPLDVYGLFDTMLVAQLLACGLWPGGKRPFSLEAVARRECGLEMGKEHQLSDWSGPISEGQLEYAAQDVAVLLPLYATMARKLADHGLTKAANVEFACIPATADMEYAGMGMDLAIWRELAEEERAALAAAKEHALSWLDPGAQTQMDLFGESRGASLNLNSPQKVLSALRTLGAELSDTRDDTLQQVIKTGGRVGQAAASVLRFRKHAKALSAFIEPYEKWVHPMTGRIHSNYRQLNPNGVGRFSAKDPNIQQLPNQTRFRRAFIAPPGRVLIIADYAAIEVRIMAWLSGDPMLTDIFRSGVDPHRRTAALIMAKEESAVTKEERQLAKAVNFGMLYGMSAEGLQAYASAGYGVDMTLAQATEFKHRYFQVYQGVARWHQRQNREARAARIVRTASGRARRWMTSRMPMPELLNTPDQGTGADILKHAMAQIRPHLKSLEAELIASVHDELVVEAPEERANEAADALKQVMVEAGAAFIDPIPVEVEVVVGTSWADK